MNTKNWYKRKNIQGTITHPSKYITSGKKDGKYNKKMTEKDSM